MPFPNLIIAGPPKTGSTSIFEWLSKHPDAHPSKVKETYYFYDKIASNSTFPNFKKDGWSKYEGMFQGWKNEKIIFEASPGYIYSKIAADELTTLKDIKVVIIYRNASDRLFSEYQFTRYKTKNFIGSFDDYVGYDGKKFIGPRSEKMDLTPFVYSWLKTLNKNQFRIISFNEIKQDPISVMKKLANYLKIDAEFYESFQFEKKNETFGLRNKKIHFFLIAIMKFVPPLIVNALSPIYYLVNKSKIPAITAKEKATKAALNHFIAKQEEEFLHKFEDLFL